MNGGGGGCSVKARKLESGEFKEICTCLNQKYGKDFFSNV